MPIQLWTGSPKANIIDLKKYENQNYWKTGIICKIYRNKTDTDGNKDNRIDEDLDVTCDIAYLLNPTDEDETFHRNVSSKLLRILVGSGSDPEDGIPASLEVARLELLGGEENIVFSGNESKGGLPETKVEIVDENTGFTGWNTVAIRKVTVKKELKEERARIKAKRQFENELKEKNEKDKEERKMEEARYANADDSALGAYDVWNVTTKAKGGSGYKGVDINTESTFDHVSEAASELSKGKGKVTFKKKNLGGFKNSKNKKKKFRRTITADD